MAGTIRKLIVEVVEARDLLPKDGTGTSSPYVVADFDGQRRRTQTVHRSLNPAWNETLEFNVNGPVEATGEPLEIDVHHDRRVGPSRRNNFLGRVRLDCRNFVTKGEEALIYFPLEKKSLFSWVRGDIGLRIYYVDKPAEEPAPPPPPPPPPEATPVDAPESEAPAPPPQAEPATAEPEAAQPPEPTTKAEPEAAPPPELQEPPTETAAETEPAAPSPENDEPLPPLPSETDPQPTEAPPPPPEPTVVHIAVPSPRPVVERAPEIIERSSYDLVDKMQYLFIRVVRARSLPRAATPHVRVVAYGHHVSTREARRSAFLEWDQTFSFPRDANYTSGDSTMDVSVWDLPPDSDVDAASDKYFLGGVCFDLSEIPLRDPPDSPLATQWYRLEGGMARGGDLMLATWIGTQADESFHNALKAGTPASHAGSKSKIYLSPKLWYLRATILETQDFMTPSRDSSISVRATLGFQVLQTRPAVGRNTGLVWNEDLIFVAAEPFGDEQSLILWLEGRHGKETAVLGTAAVPLSSVERRVDDRKVASRWLDLNSGKKGRKAGGRLHVRVCLDGGYHVTDEPAHASSDFRPSARQLWRPPVGAVELGIIGCRNLLPMRTVDGKGATDAFAVAKYGPKWARTRTVAGSFEPAWNDQFTWPVYDPCTVLTVAVFDDSGAGKEAACRPMGKVRIRLSTLESNRAYRGVYPLLLLLSTGAKRMGDIELAVRFTRATPALDLLQMYGKPMLPPMHHVRPIGAAQREPLRLAAARLVAGHLARSEPSLPKEVVLWTVEAMEPRGFSMRKVRASWHRIVVAVGWLVEAVKWAEDIRTWRNPTSTLLAHGVLVLMVWHPELVAPTAALHVFGVGVWRYRRRPRGPAAHPCVKASMAEMVEREELDEEMDTVPSSRGPELVRARYDRVRAVGARVQALLGDVAAQAERVQALVSWRDPRATGVFIICCFLVALVLYVVPGKMVAVASAFYLLRHPMFRDRSPPAALNFFRRLPSLSDRII